MAVLPIVHLKIQVWELKHEAFGGHINHVSGGGGFRKMRDTPLFRAGV